MKYFRAGYDIANFYGVKRGSIREKRPPRHPSAAVTPLSPCRFNQVIHVTGVIYLVVFIRCLVLHTASLSSPSASHYT